MSAISKKSKIITSIKINNINNNLKIIIINRCKFNHLMNLNQIRNNNKKKKYQNVNNKCINLIKALNTRTIITKKLISGYI